jgi:type IX secretion system substrate protein
MKHYIFFIFALSITISTRAFAQTDSNQVGAITCGGGVVSAGGYAGNISIGLPFVGEIWNASGDTTMLGVYDDTAFISGVAMPSSIQVLGNIFPNPSDGSITVPAPTTIANFHASLYDERGAFVLDATPFMMREGNNIQFTLHGLASGSYMLTLDDGKERYSYKLSIRN